MGSLATMDRTIARVAILALLCTGAAYALPVSPVADSESALTAHFVQQVNDVAPWTAGENVKFRGMTLGEVKTLMGALPETARSTGLLQIRGTKTGVTWEPSRFSMGPTTAASKAVSLPAWPRPRPSELDALGMIEEA